MSIFLTEKKISSQWLNALHNYKHSDTTLFKGHLYNELNCCLSLKAPDRDASRKTKYNLQMKLLF